jgi:hypothetical protein
MGTSESDITRRGFLIAALAASAAAAVPGVLAAAQNEDQHMDIQRVGSKPSVKGASEWFTGTVRIDPLFDRPEPSRLSGASVTFEPGARTAWHTHPLGQTLIVTSGCGWAHPSELLMINFDPEKAPKVSDAVQRRATLSTLIAACCTPRPPRPRCPAASLQSLLA